MYTSEELTSLANLDNGGAIELFDLELEKVLENIEDINKKGKDDRTITLTVKLKPTDTAGIISTQIEVKSKLAGQRTRSTHLMIGREGGRIKARELYQQQPLPINNVTSISERRNEEP